MAEDTTKTEAVNPAPASAPVPAPTPVDEPVANVRKGREQLDIIHERGYRVETWAGLPKYCSTFDSFDTMDEAVMVEYVANHRNGFGLYGNSATAPLSEGQRMAAVSRQGAKKKS